MCGHCGVAWRRSKLYRDAAGTLTCPDEGPGLSGVALDAINAAASRNYTGPNTDGDGGRLVSTNVDSDGTVDTSVYVQRTTLEDIET